MSNDAALATQVVLNERQARDRGWWDDMDALYWPDSTVHLSWYRGDGHGFVTGSKAMAEGGMVTVHHMYAPSARVRGERAHVEVCAEIWFPTDVDGMAAHLISLSRLNYRLERRGDEWRILSLDAIYEYGTLTPAVPGQLIQVPADELARFRPSYALLAWNASRSGLPVGGDELGDDRPEQVRAFYAAIQEWLDDAR